jgi:uncharacterized lipoprotein YajG
MIGFFNIFPLETKREDMNLKRIKKIIYFVAMISGIAALTGCGYIPEKVQVSYQPLLQQSVLSTASGAKVDVQVVDNRREKTQVSCKKGDYGVELASIRLEGDLAKEVAGAVRAELKNLGFGLSDDQASKGVDIEIQKFYNEFKAGAWGGRALAEMILGVNVKKADGDIIYSKTIMGFGEMDRVWRHSGKNAKAALEASMNDAMNKLINDKAFIQALNR